MPMAILSSLPCDNSFAGYRQGGDTDDRREWPAIPIVRELLARGAGVLAYDSVANASAKAVRSLIDDLRVAARKLPTRQPREADRA